MLYVLYMLYIWPIYNTMKNYVNMCIIYRIDLYVFRKRYVRPEQEGRQAGLLGFSSAWGLEVPGPRLSENSPQTHEPSKGPSGPL